MKLPPPSPSPTMRKVREQNVLDAVDTHALYALVPFSILCVCTCFRVLAGRACRGWHCCQKNSGKETRALSGSAVTTREAPYTFIINDLNAVGGAASDALDAHGRAVGWTEQWDEDQQAPYFWNTVTEDVTWERPEDGIVASNHRAGRSRLARTPENMETILLRHRMRSQADLDESIGVFTPAAAYSRSGSFRDTDDEPTADSALLIGRGTGTLARATTSPLIAMVASMRPDKGSFKRAADHRAASQWVRQETERPHGGWAGVSARRSTSLSYGDETGTVKEEEQRRDLEDYFRELHRRRANARIKQNITPGAAPIQNPRFTLQPIIENPQSPERRLRQEDKVPKTLAQEGYRIQKKAGEEALKPEAEASADVAEAINRRRLSEAEVTAAAKARMEETVRLQAEAEAEAGKVGMEGTIRLQAEVEAEAIALNVEKEPSEPPPRNEGTEITTDGLKLVHSIVLKVNTRCLPTLHCTLPITSTNQPYTSTIFTLKNFGVLGEGINPATGKLDQVGPNPVDMTSMCLCDSTSLQYIQPPGNPKSAGGATGRIYNWLGIHENSKFPDDVVSTLIKTGDAKYHEYKNQVSVVSTHGRKIKHSAHVIHALGPDLRATNSAFMPYSRHEALALLVQTYKNTLQQFIVSHKAILRLAPFSIGLFSGSFRDEIAELTWDAIAIAFSHLQSPQKEALSSSTGSQIQLCIFDERNMAQFTRAGFSSIEVPYDARCPGFNTLDPQLKTESGPPIEMETQCVAHLEGMELRGTVRFIGTTAFSHGEWVGLELDQCSLHAAKNDGSVGGFRYFECKGDGKRGVFIRRSNLRLLLSFEREGEAKEQLHNSGAGNAQEPKRIDEVPSFSDQALPQARDRINGEEKEASKFQTLNTTLSSDTMFEVEEPDQGVLRAFSDRDLSIINASYQTGAEGITSIDEELHLATQNTKVADCGEDEEMVNTVVQQNREMVETRIMELESAKFNIRERQAELAQYEVELMGLKDPAMERIFLHGFWITKVLVISLTGEEVWEDYEQWNQSVQARREWLHQNITSSKRNLKKKRGELLRLEKLLKECQNGVAVNDTVNMVQVLDEREEEEEEEEEEESSSGSSSSSSDEEGDLFIELEDGTEPPLVEAKAQTKVELFGEIPDLDVDVLEVSDLIGSGTFGTTFRGEYLGHNIIIKDVSKALTEVCAEELNREARLVYSSTLPHGFQHAYLLDIIAYSTQVSLQNTGSSINRGAILVLEEASCSLFDLLHAQDIADRRGKSRVDSSVLQTLPLSMRQRLMWLRQIALGMAAAHKLMGAPHLSLTSRNILLSPDIGRANSGCTAKVADFCFSTVRRSSLLYDDANKQKLKESRLLEFNPLLDCRALPWMSPEVIDEVGAQARTGQEPGCPADVFSFSVIMWEVITGALPHEGQSPHQIVKFILKDGCRLPLPSDEDLSKHYQNLDDRSEQPISQRTTTNSYLSSDRVAHMPLPRGRGMDSKVNSMVPTNKKPTNRKREERRRHRMKLRHQKSLGGANPRSLRQMYTESSFEDPRRRPIFENIAVDIGMLIQLLPPEVALAPPPLIGNYMVDEGGDAWRNSLKINLSSPSFNLSPIEQSSRKKDRSSLGSEKSAQRSGEDSGTEKAAKDHRVIGVLCESPVAFVNAVCTFSLIVCTTSIITEYSKKTSRPSFPSHDHHIQIGEWP